MLIAFLRNVRLTIVAAVALPLAVIPTFLFIQVFGGSINLMSMGGLAVAIGLVIDDAVVVVEGIHRREAEGEPGVVHALSELVTPLLTSTLTTVVVFAPLGLLSGVVGQFFRALSLSLSVAVLLSLAISVTVPTRRPDVTAPGGIEGAFTNPNEGDPNLAPVFAYPSDQVVIPLNLAPILRDPQQRSDITGQATVDLRIAGASRPAFIERLSGRFAFTGPRVSAAGYDATAVKARGTLAGRRIELDARAMAYGGAATASSVMAYCGFYASGEQSYTSYDPPDQIVARTRDSDKTPVHRGYNNSEGNAWLSTKLLLSRWPRRRLRRFILCAVPNSSGLTVVKTVKTFLHTGG